MSRHTDPTPTQGGQRLSVRAVGAIAGLLGLLLSGPAAATLGSLPKDSFHCVSPPADVSGLNIDVREGIATIGGQSTRALERYHARRIASRTPGVTHVIDASVEANNGTRSWSDLPEHR